MTEPIRLPVRNGTHGTTAVEICDDDLVAIYDRMATLGLFPQRGEWPPKPTEEMIRAAEKSHTRAELPAGVHAPRHEWDAAGERCVKCGDKDWMGGPCVPKQTVANKIIQDAHAAVDEPWEYDIVENMYQLMRSVGAVYGDCPQTCRNGLAAILAAIKAGKVPGVVPVEVTGSITAENLKLRAELAAEKERVKKASLAADVNSDLAKRTWDRLEETESQRDAALAQRDRLAGLLPGMKKALDLGFAFDGDVYRVHHNDMVDLANDIDAALAELNKETK